MQQADSRARPFAAGRPRHPRRRRLRARVLRARGALRVLQRRVPAFRVPGRAQRRPGRMHPGLPFPVRPGGCRRQGAGSRQGPAFTAGLQAARAPGRAGGCRRVLLQDRRAPEERDLRAQRGARVQPCAGRPGGKVSGPLLPCLFRPCERRFHPRFGQDIQPWIYGVVVRRQARQLVVHGRSQVDGGVRGDGGVREAFRRRPEGDAQARRPRPAARQRRRVRLRGRIGRPRFQG